MNTFTRVLLYIAGGIYFVVTKRWHLLDAIQAYLEIVGNMIQFEQREEELRKYGYEVNPVERGIVYTDYAYRKEIFLLTLTGRH